MANDSQLAVAGNTEQMAALQVRAQVNQLQYLMSNVLQKGEHYGVIPGTKGKPSLLQPGAEKICLMFKLVPRYRVEKTALPGGHREVEVTCTLYQRGSDVVEGEGLGSCSTMESKYRYRNKWVNGNKQREENPDIADTYNTVLKMAKKRALVDAVKSTTAASDIFTQDVEDLPAWMKDQPAQEARVEPREGQQVSQEDLEWLRSTTATVAAMGYDPAETKRYLWQEYQRGGKQAAQDAVRSMIASAGGQAEQPEQPAAVEYEAEDVEF